MRALFHFSSTFDYNKRLLEESRDIWRHINLFEVGFEKAAMFAHKMFPVANLKDQILDRICYWSILYGMFQITCAFQNL